MPDTNVNDHAIELMQLAIDGQATAAEQQEVGTIIASSSEARALFDSLREVRRRLEEYELVPAPSIKEEVLAAIRAQRTWRPVPFHPRGRRRIILGFGYAAAAAVLLILIAVDRVSLSRNDEVRARDAVGTMASRDVPEWPVVARATSGGAVLLVRRSGDQYAIEPSAPGSQVTVRWDRDKLALSQIESRSAAQSDKAAGEVTFGSGPDKPIVVLRRHGSSAPAEVQLLVNGVQRLKVLIE